MNGSANIAKGHDVLFFPPFFYGWQVSFAKVTTSYLSTFPSMFEPLWRLLEARGAVSKLAFSTHLVRSLLVNYVPHYQGYLLSTTYSQQRNDASRVSESHGLPQISIRQLIAVHPSTAKTGSLFHYSIQFLKKVFPRAVAVKLTEIHRLFSALTASLYKYRAR